MPAFTQAGYRVIAHDRRGWGRSVIDPSGPQPYAADDLQALMDHLGIDRIHLVGTAAGAIASLDFALSFPQRLRSLVVANSMGESRTRSTWRSAAGSGRRSSTRCPPRSASWDPRIGRQIPRARADGFSRSA